MSKSLALWHANSMTCTKGYQGQYFQAICQQVSWEQALIQHQSSQQLRKCGVSKLLESSKFQCSHRLTSLPQIYSWNWNLKRILDRSMEGYKTHSFKQTNHQWWEPFDRTPQLFVKPLNLHPVSPSLWVHKVSFHRIEPTIECIPHFVLDNDSSQCQQNSPSTPL